eukprot:7075230-Prymnesium_polylepis.2
MSACDVPDTHAWTRHSRDSHPLNPMNPMTDRCARCVRVRQPPDSRRARPCCSSRGSTLARSP